MNCMDFLITEQQLQLILEEQDKSKLATYMKILHSFTSDIVQKAKKKFGLNLKLLLTWGASVGGLVLPLSHFIETGSFELNDSQKVLILVGVAAILFYDNKVIVSQIKDLIKENKIEKQFNSILKKGKELKEVFIDFLVSLNLSLRNITELVSYSFLIPIIQDLQEIASNSKDLNTAAIRIVKRIVASGVVTLSAEALTTVIKKILKRLR